MPGIPLAAREHIQSGNLDQMRQHGSQVHLSSEEEVGAEEGLSAYCKPVELYNILQRRAIRNPLFLQRCLRYKIETKHCKRLRMKICVSAMSHDGLQIQSLFPILVILARRVPDSQDIEYPEVFRYTEVHSLRSSNITERKKAQTSFILPEMNRLAKEAESGVHFILFISYAETNSFCESNMSKDSSDNMSYSSKIEKYCLWGKIPLASLFSSWEKSLNLKLGGRAEMMLTLHLHPSCLKFGCDDNEKSVSFQPFVGTTNLINMKQVQMIISAVELGAKEKSSYNSYTYNNVPVASSSHVMRLRSGNVIFNYRYCGDSLQKTEVTEDFICPFCLVGCSSFKGLSCHLTSSHDLFSYDFWETDEYQAVNVSLKFQRWRSEIIADGVDPKLQTFFYCWKLGYYAAFCCSTHPGVRTNPRNPIQNSKYVYPLAFASNTPGTSELFDKADDAQSSKDDMARSSSVNGSHTTLADAEVFRFGGNLAPPPVLQFAKSRKLSIEHADHRNRALLEKRQFFHSHRAQPMLLEQVLSDHDSEDEVDDDVADLEDRRMLDDFIDVSKDEKQIMHLWNSFVRKQRVLADSHIPWACEAFSRLHGHELVQAPALVWCWRLMMIKLWNHGLLDARTINNCNLILNEASND